ncbi:SMI1-KNR4 cell-wall [Mucilaginibacter mallensis]|uniref:SMI1-KNR4 cell-wall n=1 Tax=Mucilaginibacter mallensis TaxID=652787 RepID=A0A1H2BAR6_MUCMA|nr:SMI1/KNR4 family protein [Mucilaginibacter mallensis]SDT55375.1 SMI1-KNR4 cell-wall [Mucilaginibacter mallensis]
MKKYFKSHGESITTYNIKQQLDIKMPFEYVKFLQEINGGILDKHIFELRQYDPNKTNPNIYIIIDEFLSFEQLIKAWHYTKEELSDYNLLPIANVRGGMLVCCRQEETINAELFFYDPDFGPLKLTDSLLDFLNLLISEKEIDDEKYK